MSDPNELSEDFLDQYSIQIARVVVAAGHYDDALSETIADLLELKPLQEAVLVRPVQPRAKLDTLNRLGKQFLAKDDSKKLSTYVDAAKKTLDERNALIHGSPGHKDGKIMFRSFTGQYRLTGSPQRWTIQRVSDLATAIIDHSDELAGIVAPLASAKEELQSFQTDSDGFWTSIKRKK